MEILNDAHVLLFIFWPACKNGNEPNHLALFTIATFFYFERTKWEEITHKQTYLLNISTICTMVELCITESRFSTEICGWVSYSKQNGDKPKCLLCVFMCRKVNHEQFFWKIVQMAENWNWKLIVQQKIGLKSMYRYLGFLFLRKHLLFSIIKLDFFTQQFTKLACSVSLFNIFLHFFTYNS